MQNYLDLLQKILNTGEDRSDRTGVGTLSLFGEQLRFDLSRSFPMVTTKKLHWHSIRTELLWMLRGKTNERWLSERKVTIWKEWAKDDGDLGPVYGAQWRHWGRVVDVDAGQDQLRILVNDLQANPSSRRHLITAWNPDDVPHSALPPCHLLMQFYVNSADDWKNRRLSCHMYQRSADVFLGVPYNIASYALLTNLIAMEVGMGVGELIISFGDVHIYKNHIDQVRWQLQRQPVLDSVSLAAHFKKGALLALDDQPGYEPDDFELVNYKPWPAIKAEVAV